MDKEFKILCQCGIIIIIIIIRRTSHLLYMDDLKLPGRNENELKNEMKIVQTVSQDINMNFGLEKCARICLKRNSVQSKMHVGSTFENDNLLGPELFF